MDPATFALSITGTAGVFLGIVWYIMKKGMHSKCLIKGMSIELNVHKQTKADEVKVETGETPPIDPIQTAIADLIIATTTSRKNSVVTDSRTEEKTSS